MSLDTIDPDILAEVRAALDAGLADWDQLIANGDFSNPRCRRLREAQGGSERKADQAGRDPPGIATAACDATGSVLPASWRARRSPVLATGDRIMTHVFGWWEWDADGPALVNRVTGERVRRRGALSDETIPGGPWLRVDYEHADLRFPLLVQRRLHRWEKTGRLHQVWRLDYVRSTDLWRREASGTSENPPFGVWRRVDDCIGDALACWPDAATGEAGPPLIGIDAVGGWLNGAWREDWIRSFPHFDDARRMELERDAVLRADNPQLMALDAAPLSPWRFHGYPPPGADPAKPISDFVGVGGKQRTRQFGNDVWVLPAALPFDGVEGRTAFMQSTDGKRILYPLRATHKGAVAHVPPRIVFDYIDPDFRAGLVAINRTTNPKTSWAFRIDNCFGGRRRPEREDDLWIHQGRQGMSPSHALWRRLSWALVDAWLFWEGTAARCPLWQDELALVGAARVDVIGHYFGGLYPAAEHFARWNYRPIPPLTAAWLGTEDHCGEPS